MQKHFSYGDVAQLVRASDSYPEGRQFNSAHRYQNFQTLTQHFSNLKRLKSQSFTTDVLCFV